MSKNKTKTIKHKPNTPRYIIVKLQKIKDKDKVFEFEFLKGYEDIRRYTGEGIICNQ